MNVYCEVSEISPVSVDGIERYAALFPKDRIVPCAPGASWSVKAGDGVTLVYWPFQAPECRELPMHGHQESQSGYVVDGEMIMKYEDGTRRVLKTGDFYWIPGGTKHGATIHDRVTIIDVYAPGRPDYEEIFRFSLRANAAQQEAPEPQSPEALVSHSVACI